MWSKKCPVLFHLKPSRNVSLRNESYRLKDIAYNTVKEIYLRQKVDLSNSSYNKLKRNYKLKLFQFKKHLRLLSVAQHSNQKYDI